MPAPYSNSNLWMPPKSSSQHRPEMAGDLDTEFLVIGGGITGCSAALRAAELGESVVLLEARTIGHGGSGRNVGLVNAGLWLDPESIEQRLGKESGGKLNKLLLTAPAAVFSLIEKHDISCDLSRNGTLQCADSNRAYRALRERAAQVNRIGGQVEIIGPDEVAANTGTHRYSGGLMDPRAGTIQPAQYCAGLADAASRLGATIFEGSCVNRVYRDGTRWIAKTPSATITAKKLLLATNAYAANIQDISMAEFTAVQYFQCATEPLEEGLPERILPTGLGCWDTALVMSSFRKDASGRLLIGSIGRLTDATKNIHERWAARKLRFLFPDLNGVKFDHSWDGRIAMTNDHLPKIVRLGPDAYSVFGFSGRGIGPGTVFGQLAADSLLQREEDILPLVPIDRYTNFASRTKSCFIELGAAALHLIQGRL